jgi:FkbM family methyltransferase
MLASYVTSGQLTLVNAGISDCNEDVTLTISGDDLGSSSTYQAEMVEKAPVASFTVPGITTQQLFRRFGVPFYLKVDIEGADRLSVLALTPATKPEYVSFEI